MPPVVAPARPAVTLDGRAAPALTEGLLRLQVSETQDGLVSCEATFGNWGPDQGRVGFLYFGRDQLDFGKAFAVSLGGGRIFDGRVTGLEGSFPDGGPPEVTVLAEDRFQDLRMTRRTRTFTQRTDEQVIRSIAQDHGLTPQLDLSGPTHIVLAQLNQSDLAFVRERARALDAELWMDGRTLHIAQHSRRRGARIRIGYGHELSRFTVLADLALQRSSVVVTGWDVSAKRALSEQADDRALGGELGSADSGASVLRTALAERRETVAHAVPCASAEARAEAEAIFRRGARRFVRGRGTATVDAMFRVGATVQIDGVGPLFSGDYYVTETRHLFDGSHGMRCDFVVERPGLGRPR
jgi:uncharacterized protein